MSANIVDAIRFLRFHWAYKVASKVQTVKYDARTRKVKRHSWAWYFEEKSKNSTSANIVDAIRFIGVHWRKKWPQMLTLSNMTPARAKWKGTAERDMFRKHQKTQLEPTSLMPSGLSASSEHQTWPQKFALSNMPPAQSEKAQVSTTCPGKIQQLNFSQHRWRIRSLGFHWASNVASNMMPARAKQNESALRVCTK